MGETPWIAWCRMAHARPLPLAALADVARLEAVCPVCAAWNDGDPACPAHGGTYQDGMACPLGGERRGEVVTWADWPTGAALITAPSGWP